MAEDKGSIVVQVLLCTHCRQMLPTAAFSPSKGKKRGFASHCRMCRSYRREHFHTKPTNRCAKEGCQRTQKACQLCSVHYEAQRPARLARCSVSSCDKLVRATGLCSAHYSKRRKYDDPLMRVKGVYDETEQRLKFWSSALLTANPDKCWTWQKGKTKKGYGSARFMGQPWRAHRLAFFLSCGHIPQPLALHSCDNRACVNPNHLREGTAAENTRDMMERDRWSNQFRSIQIREEINHGSR